MINKEIWGKHIWYTIHFIALGFPNKASNIDKKNYKNFYMNLPNIIPCQECEKHLITNLNNYPIDNYLDTKERLFEWTVILHNQVNKILGKNEWSLDKANKYYKDPKKYTESPIQLFKQIGAHISSKVMKKMLIDMKNPLVKYVGLMKKV